ncbi:hypothetical protein ACFSZS_03325 [Seohaeicola zhoushanensis]
MIITASYSGNTSRDWLPASMAVSSYGDVDARSTPYTSEFGQPKNILWARTDIAKPIERHFRPGGKLGRYYNINGATFEWKYDGTEVTHKIDGTDILAYDANGVRDRAWYLARSGGELTIAAGSITPHSIVHRIDTEADAASDDLETIQSTNAPGGQVLYLRTESSARDVVIKHGVGNIICASGADFTLSSTDKVAHLVRIGTSWMCVNG